jgi:hypothetical protein
MDFLQWCPTCDRHFDATNNELYCSFRCKMADSAPSTASNSPASLPVLDFPANRTRASSFARYNVPPTQKDNDWADFDLDQQHKEQREPYFYWTGSLNALATKLWSERTVQVNKPF